MRIARCKGCGVELVWAKDPSGKPIPLETRTVAYLVTLDEKRGYTCTRIRPTDSDQGNTVVPLAGHLTNCPMAQAFGRRDPGFTPPPEETAPSSAPEQTDLLEAFATGEPNPNQEEIER